MWYTDAVLRAVQQFIRRLIAHTPYPLALQCLISLVLLATLPSALAESGYVLSARFGLLFLGRFCTAGGVRSGGF